MISNIEIQGLSFSYTKELPLFEDFIFASDAPLIVLRGTSGCGKTTLLKIMFGNVFENVLFSKLVVPSNRYMILQDDALCPWLTGLQNITRFFPIKVQEYEQSPLYKRIEPFLHQKACNMSFGQRRLVELFRAILFRPKLLLWDEPLNYLDGKSRDVVVEELAQFIQTEQCRVIITDHIDQEFKGVRYEVYRFPVDKPIKTLCREE